MSDLKKYLVVASTIPYAIEKLKKLNSFSAYKNCYLIIVRDLTDGAYYIYGINNYVVYTNKIIAQRNEFILLGYINDLGKLCI